MNEDDTVCYLIEATTNTAEFINGMMRMRLIDEIILYTVPFYCRNGTAFVQKQLFPPLTGISQNNVLITEAFHGRFTNGQELKNKRKCPVYIHSVSQNVSILFTFVRNVYTFYGG